MQAQRNFCQGGYRGRRHTADLRRPRFAYVQQREGIHRPSFSGSQIGLRQFQPARQGQQPEPIRFGPALCFRDERSTAARMTDDLDDVCNSPRARVIGGPRTAALLKPYRRVGRQGIEADVIAF